MELQIPQIDLGTILAIIFSLIITAVGIFLRSHLADRTKKRDVERRIRRIHYRKLKDKCLAPIANNLKTLIESLNENEGGRNWLDMLRNEEGKKEHVKLRRWKIVDIYDVDQILSRDLANHFPGLMDKINLIEEQLPSLEKEIKECRIALLQRILELIKVDVEEKFPTNTQYELDRTLTAGYIYALNSPDMDWWANLRQEVEKDSRLKLLQEKLKDNKVIELAGKINSIRKTLKNQFSEVREMTLKIIASEKDLYGKCDYVD